jgi:hypothetical protein
MAGRNASANLGGMLSQIGGAFGAAGQSVGQGLMQPITMAFRPQLDPNDPDSLRRQSEFFGKIGQAAQQKAFADQAIVVNNQQKAQRAQQGQAAIVKIQEAMTATMNDPAMPEGLKQQRMATLQNAANQAAAKFGLDPTQTMNMGREVQSGYNALETQQENLQTIRRSNQRQAGMSALEAAASNPEQFQQVRNQLEASGFGDIVRNYDLGQEEYKAKMAEYSGKIQDNGQWTNEETALAEKLGVSASELATWKSNPPRGRIALRQRAQSEAAKVRTEQKERTLADGVVKDLVPGVLRELKREGSEWFDIFDKDVEDLADDVLSDEDALNDISALVRASGVKNPAEVKEIILSELRKKDQSIWQKWGWAKNAVDSYNEKRGVKTITVDGKEVTIEEVTE